MTPEEVCDKLIRWRQDPHALLFPQFLAQVPLSEPELENLCAKDPSLQIAVDTTCAVLAQRIAAILLSEAKMSRPRETVLLRYLFKYDQDYVKRELKMRVAVAQKEMETCIAAYEVVNYSQAQLPEPFLRQYKEPPHD